ncbi:hypothetical protein EB796_019153 [Bugula neritina]|uniref:Uncharacterized protein n=1 Tax=Bugula neritina TaxID=10212 RepID=A0A7J7J972_BUGNE|nr:hypothetical protein EB796_019153 [Bugula neritina]
MVIYCCERSRMPTMCHLALLIVQELRFTLVNALLIADFYKEAWQVAICLLETAHSTIEVRVAPYFAESILTTVILWSTCITILSGKTERDICLCRYI